MAAANDLNTLILRRALVLTAEFAILSIILGIAAHMRLANVAENPAWYTDETTHIDIARHLAQGEMRYMAVKDSTLLFGRVPLFHLLLAAEFRVLPERDPIFVLRTLTGTLGVFSVLLLYLAVRLHGERTLALLAASALTIYPQAIVYSRFGFSYNLLTIWTLVALIGLSQYTRIRRTRWLVLGALAVGLAAVTEIAGFILLIPLVLVIVIMARRPLALVWALPLAFAPFAIYTLMMLSRAPQAFSYDLAFTLGRLGGNPPQSFDGQITNLIHNYNELVNESLWMPLGFVGLFLVRPLRLAAISLLLFWLPFLSIGRGFALYSLSAYYMIPLLPFIVLGAAALVYAATRNLRRAVSDALRGLPNRVRQGIAVGAVIFAFLLFVILPMQPSLDATLQAVNTVFATSIDSFLINTENARAVAGYINANSTPDDIVIVSPVVGWLLNTQVADFQMTAAAAGNMTPHLPGDLPRERWAFPMAYTAARYIVIDNLWYNWGVIHVPGLDAIVRDVETWPRVFEAGDLKVYVNPLLN